MEWMQDAACSGTNTDMWFNDDEESMTAWRERQVVLAKVCSRCSVWDVCRVYSIGDDQGIFGGSSRNIRRQVRCEMNLIGPDNARHRGSRAAELVDEGYTLAKAMTEVGLPDHPYFHRYEDFEYRFC